MNYSPEITSKIVEIYLADPTRDTVNKLAVVYKKSVKSIIGKLAKEGVYRREAYTTKTGERPITKSEIIESLADKLDTTSENLVGLDKTPKNTLKILDSLVSSIV
jgi:hypothetical protein